MIIFTLSSLFLNKYTIKQLHINLNFIKCQPISSDSILVQHCLDVVSLQDGSFSRLQSGSYNTDAIDSESLCEIMSYILIIYHIHCYLLYPLLRVLRIASLDSYHWRDIRNGHFIQWPLFKWGMKPSTRILTQFPT